jgi:geranylgeranyl diphosphate synthase type II
VDVDGYMAERIPLIDSGIEARLGEGAEFPKGLKGAMRHLLFPGGKRLRPMFSLAAAEAVGGKAEAALPIAIAVELVHTYSLIHDDLPCMDDDAIRRGRPTVHIAYDEATAVLAGDALLTEAFAVLAEPTSIAASGGRDAGRDAEAALFAVRCLATAAGAAGLVGGQADDLRFEVCANALADGTSRAQLASIHARKTAALFQAAIVGGARMAGAADSELEQLRLFSEDVGIAFQIADDLLDADSDEAASVLRIQAADDARNEAEALLDRALSRIDELCERAEPLRELARFAVRRRQ